MADPLSVASSVAGLVSLGLTLCGGLHNYFSAVRDRHQDIETEAQSLALLQSNLFIIQSSTLKLGHRHALSANGVNQGLANCESQLVTLHQMMLDLTRDEGLSTMKGKLRKQMTIARYPFDQKKLSQLQAQLSKANATLSNFVQNFNLDINIGICEDLRVLKNYTNVNDSITHNMLGTIARRLDTIGPSVQRTEMEVATMFGCVQDKPLATGSHMYDKAVKPRYLQNSQKEERMVKRLNDPQCTCYDPTPRSIHQVSSYIDRSWGGAASPLDVDDNGNNITHISMEEISFEDALVSIRSLLSYMFNNGVPISASNFYRHETRFSGSTGLLDNDLSQVCGQYLDIAGAFGFNDIFRAVMQRDWKTLEALTMGDQLPPGMLETDMYGRNIFHASITLPEGLDILLQHSQAVSLLVDDESIFVSPLWVAISLTKKVCTQPDKWVLCQNCHCADSLELFLEAD
ncbi:hypothetical protein DER46DRAFT_687415 [Fusarium sp. MPI-SDFR-AT-0072]|nr:hypothetical protein DER46DRAFT_687415 [Fusarium sp. MPI-SDFR-AT-0072]